MAKRRSRGFEALLLLAIVAVAVPAIVLGSMALRSKGAVPMTQIGVSPTVQSSASATAVSTEPQICAGCWGDGSPQPIVKGKPVEEDGVQVLTIGLVAGWYVPNRFMVQAGRPVAVVFTGRAEGCLAEPEFPELGVKGNMSSGSVTMALGRLKPGTYTFTCSMGVNEGTITVE
jgi:hypothetical protein